MRIDEVDKKGNAKIKTNKDGSITPFRPSLLDGNLPKKD